MDAYTLRKLAPRILIGVVGINLSIYLCLAISDIVVVVGNGLGSLLSAPFVTAGSYDFNVEGFDDGNITNTAALAGGAGIFVGAGGLAAVVGGIASLATAPLATLGSLLLLMVPIALLALAILITIVIRQALLVFLIIVSPIAIALFVIPNTERYFRQWWDLFLKTLMVYPVIAAIFAMSDVFGAIIFQSASTGSDAAGVVKLITGVLVIYAPLFMIPFAFRIAGGAIGQVANVASAGAKRVGDFAPIKGRRDIARQQLQHGMIQQRADIAGRLQARASRDRGFIGRHVGNRTLRGLSGAVGGYNVEQQASALRAEKMKQLNDQIATGRDEEIRGLTVNKTWADRHGVQNEDWRVNSDGVRQYRTLGGAWVDEAHVMAGHGRWGNDSYAQQAALSYEMRKASTEDEFNRIRTHYQDVATSAGGWGLSDGMAGGVLKGAGFENQNRSIEFKHMNTDGSINNEALAKDVYENKGSYQLSQMTAHTFESLREAHRTGTPETQRRVEGIAETFMTRYGGGRQVAGMEGETPIMAPDAAAAAGGTTSGEVYQTNAPGSGHVAEAARQLAVDVGVYRPLDQSTETHSASGPSDNPRQN